MKIAALLLALASSASAFAPTTQKSSATQLQALGDMAGFTAPFKGFDPLGLADLGSEETLAWFRAAELKHSRVAMLATTGYIVQASGYHFPGMLSKDVSFESLSTMKPFDAWDAMPEEGKLPMAMCLLPRFSMMCGILIFFHYLSRVLNDNIEFSLSIRLNRNSNHSLYRATLSVDHIY